MPKQSFSSGQTLLSSQMNDLQTNDFNQTVSTKTDAYTFVVGDRGTRVVLNDTTARTFTVDDAIFSAGDTIQVHNINTGVLTIAAGAGVTLNGADVLTVAQYQSGTIFFTSASSAIFFPTAKTVSSGVVQVKSAFKADAFATSSTSYTDLTGLSVSITPTSASNKVLVVVNMQVGRDTAGQFALLNLLRGASNIAQSTGGSTSNQTAFAELNVAAGMPIVFLDSPATTSATTYKVQVASTGGGNTVYINRNETATRGASSSITVMEVTP